MCFLIACSDEPFRSFRARMAPLAICRTAVHVTDTKEREGWLSELAEMARFVAARAAAGQHSGRSSRAREVQQQEKRKQTPKRAHEKNSLGWSG